MAVVRQGPKGTIFIDRGDPALEEQLDAKFVRIPGLLQWKIPGEWTDDLLSFGAAISSGRVDEVTFEHRKAQCLTCPLMQQDASGTMYCNGCRCGRWILSRLDGSFASKLGWKRFQCPMGRF